ncbi:D-2-hydroxyacid dehydrogenase [Ruania halotolerans]|uniref:D-2-hydroxyacid dehydrogenase n=1 Tax=Ruania halotolerans TaxID=2897773 RepID=UPI001E59BCCB|nr:D-2-hydroxyacid dehydrogenase [Ruania halotolerans]UFU07904.1 D-2-hydroxyacid dehydrogenase [Ruania halotolerans]
MSGGPDVNGGPVRSALLVKAAAGIDGERVQAAAGARAVHRVESFAPEAVRAAGADPALVGAVLGAGPSDDLSALPALTWVHSGAAGVDGWLSAGSPPDGVVLTSAVGNGAIPLAEHALMLMLMLSRQAPRWFAAQQRHVWDRYTHGELAGATLGIIGYGNSGRDLARKAQACHMPVQAVRREDSGAGTHGASGAGASGYGDDGSVDDAGVRVFRGRAGLEQVLATSDHVVVTAPWTPQTQNLIGTAELALMRPSAFLIVISRGGIVTEDALVGALRDGVIAGAGLDAHATEPLPASSPLWDLQNVIITPHNGATTAATAERGTAIMLENVSRWSHGEQLLNVVDRTRGY